MTWFAGGNGRRVGNASLLKAAAGEIGMNGTASPGARGRRTGELGMAEGVANERIRTGNRYF